MNIEARIDSLKAKHAALENEIEVENARPLPDDAHIHALKKEKLKLKEEMEHLTH